MEKVMSLLGYGLMNDRILKGNFFFCSLFFFLWVVLATNEIGRQVCSVLHRLLLILGAEK